MVKCARCQQRLAVVFITKMEGDKRISEGLCLRCAKEAGLPLNNMLDDVLRQMGMTQEQLESMEDSIAPEMENLFGEGGLFPPMGGGEVPSDLDEGEPSGAPAIDFPRVYGEETMPADQPAREGGEVPEERRRRKPDHTNENSRKEKGRSGSGNRHESRPQLKFLNTYCRSLTAAAREGRLDSIVGRERELARVVQILCRRQKSNPCLIGEPGVGKTAIAEALALKVASGDVPYKLRGKEIYLVDMTALVAGTQFRGQFEQRMLGLLSEVKACGNIILVIDEVHNIVGTGEAEGSVNAANMLKPALSRGEVQIIGATTLTEYRKYIEKDTALERRFQPVMVEEPSLADAVAMLRGIKHYYESFHNIRIPEGVLARAVAMSERYITDRYLPDKAIDLLDEAAAHLSLSSAALNETLEIRDKLLALKVRREDAENPEVSTEAGSEQKRYEELAKIKAEELQLGERLKALEADCAAVVLTPAHLAEVIEVWTGIPATTINENEFEQVDHLAERLKSHVVGQNAAVDAVARAVKRNRAGVSARRKPVSFIFAGPTGVGKTELVKRLASDLFHSPETLIRLDMSEFMEKASVSRLIGSPPGYVGYDDAGQLTEKIRRKPYSVVLFDEIEKAHPDVLGILLQILDEGRLTDAHGKTVNFENTIIVMTTNAGSDRSTATIGFAEVKGEGGMEHCTAATMKALSEFLRPEFINRVDEVITFASLTREDFARIAHIQLDELVGALADRGLTFTYTNEAAALVADASYSAKFGARNMRRYIQRHVEDALAEAIIADYEQKITHAHLTVEDGELRVKTL